MLDLDRALDQLAPEVDLAASRALFERHRGLDVRPRARRRGLVGIAAAVVVLLGVAAFAIATREPDIALQTAEQGTTSLGATVAGPSEDGEDEILADVELPPVGEARSFLLDDGFPLWVVHHGDGTASAVPGVAPEPTDLPDDGSTWVPTGNWDIIQWVESGWFRGLAGYDAWGRALAQLPDALVVDLTGFVAEVHGDRVLVRRSGADDILGDPVFPTGWPDSANWPAVEPVLPAVASIDALPTGWSKVDVDVVTVDGVARLCDVEDIVMMEDGVMQPCPGTAPLVPSILGAPGTSTWSEGPVLVEVDPDGTIVAVAHWRRGGLNVVDATGDG